MPKMNENKKQMIVGLLKRNSRMTLTEISRSTSIPVSTVFDYLKQIEKEYLFTVIERRLFK